MAQPGYWSAACCGRMYEEGDPGEDAFNRDHTNNRCPNDNDVVQPIDPHLVALAFKDCTYATFPYILARQYAVVWDGAERFTAYDLHGGLTVVDSWERAGVVDRWGAKQVVNQWVADYRKGR